MTLIVTATNATCGGVRVPPGVFEFPMHGTLAVVAENMPSTNAVVGSADTLCIGPQTFTVMQAGFQAEEWLVLGFSLTFATAAMTALVRKAIRMMADQSSYTNV